ncbi:hypothetical protein BBJ28_00004891 [Nothophytophthora sp. Chile5]|nr:hypothetical protein BBJ28_00004891 [Nothophytophthora sp. Chile5]
MRLSAGMGAICVLRRKRGAPQRLPSATQKSGGGSRADRELDAISAASSSGEDEDEGVSSEATPPRHDDDRPRSERGAIGGKAKLYAVPREEQLRQRDGSAAARPSSGTTETKTPPTRESTDRTLETHFHGFSPDEEVDDDGEGNYQVVKKSIYKTNRKGFLHRLAGTPGAASAKHGKYVISDITSIVTGEDDNETSQPPPPRKAKEVQNAEILINEEEGIQVAIDSSPATLGGALVVHQMRHLNAEDAAMGGPSEVVIHSGESDASFATLNPVIKGSLQRGQPTFVASAPAAPAMTASSAISIAKGSPILMEIPTVDEANNCRDRLLLIINALGASGLPKAEKFGTQSCLLEMRVCEAADMLVVSEMSGCSSYMMRTELHKKGGSEAQWNQQFTTSLRSKKDQFLHVAVKTSSKILVGEANVPLDKVGGLFYDQHYPLFRPDSSNEMHGDDPGGQLHLQLKIVDAASVPLASAVVPPLRLPSSPVLSIVELSNKRIPPVLRNGNLFFKIPYHTHNLVGYAAGPTRQWVTVVRAVEPPHLQLTWGDPSVSGSAEKRGVRSLDLALVTEVREGHGTKAFSAQTDSSVIKEKEKCFSLITKTRTLDLVAASKEEAHIWVSSLRDLLFAPATSADALLDSARIIEGFKQSALTSRDPGATSDDKPVAAVPSKRMVAAWRSRIFNLARNGRLDEIVECWQDGCPIDLLESGSGDTLLILACRQGNDQLVELCLSRRAKNDPHPEFGETALQVAVNACQPHCVKLLLSTAAKSDMDSEIVNHIDPNNDAPLHVAASHGDLACLQLLLHHGADICVVEEFGRTPLHCAVANGNHDCVAYLLDVGGDSVLNSGDHEGDTALHYAALSGNEATAKLLLESAANVFATNIHSETPYDIAVREKQQKCAELIAKYFLTNEKDTSCFPWEKPNIEERGIDGYTAPHPQVDAKAETLAPDAIIRLRLTEARKQKSLATLVSPASSTATTTCSTPGRNCQRPADSSLDEMSIPHSSTPNKSIPATDLPQIAAVPLEVLVPLGDGNRPLISHQPSPESPEPSKYEARTGLKLSVNVSAPPAQDGMCSFIMDERVVNAALLGCLQRFFPTEKEKQALQNFDGSVSTLGKAERFFFLLFQVPGMQERIDMFLYKMEFTRTHSSLLSRILVVKRACRDLAENFHFIQALGEENKSAFIAGYLSEADEKLKSFRVDLQNAVGVELMELQMQLNRLVSGIRPIRSFVERSPSSSLTRAEDHDCKARDILQRFLLETRAPLAEIESEYEAMELWGDKLLAVFGESKASCHIAAILQGVVELLK